MFKFFFRQTQPGTADRSDAEPRHEAEWRRDPLLHPQIQAMSQRQLADLPIDRPQPACLAMR